MALIISSMSCGGEDLGEGGTVCTFIRPGILSNMWDNLSSLVLANSSRRAKALSEMTGAVIALV